MFVLLISRRLKFCHSSLSAAFAVGVLGVLFNTDCSLSGAVEHLTKAESLLFTHNLMHVLLF